MAEFALYNYFRSSASYRVRCALHLKGIEFEYRPIHLLEGGGQQHQASYRDINPAREVPTLVHQGRLIGQSMAILEYLEEVAAGPRLFPQDPYQKALVRQFCENINCLQPLQNLRTIQYLTAVAGLSETQKQNWLHEWFSRNAETLEATLRQHTGEYCFGDTVTAADCFLAPQVFAAKRFNFDFSKYPHITRVNANLERLTAFIKAHPHKQVDTPPELR